MLLVPQTAEAASSVILLCLGLLVLWKVLFVLGEPVLVVLVLWSYFLFGRVSWCFSCRYSVCRISPGGARQQNTTKETARLAINSTMVWIICLCCSCRKLLRLLRMFAASASNVTWLCSMCYFLCFFCLTMPCLSKWVASLFLVLFVIPCFSFACRISFEGARPWAMTLQRGTTSLRIHLGSDSGYRLPHFGLPLLFVQFVRGICFPLVSFSFSLGSFFLISISLPFVLSTEWICGLLACV